MPQGSESTKNNTPPTSALGFDRGWIFCFSVCEADAPRAQKLINQIYAHAHARIDSLPSRDVNGLFRPRSGEGVVFIIRQTPQTDLDIGILAGDVEDALRDAGITPGPQLENMADIDGVKYTAYRNETDSQGNLILAADWAEIERARPPHQLFNPFLKPDPWADMIYEYSPSAEALTPPQSKTTPSFMVEDFDKDLGNLLNSIFSGIDTKYLTQPESAPGWIFDNNFGGAPMYKFFACPETIKPVRQTLRKAGVPFHHVDQGDWHGAIIAAQHFDQAQSCLQRPDAAKELRDYYIKAAKNPTLPPADEQPDALFVSDI